MQKFNFSYDKEHDDLFLHRPDSKSKGSVEIGNLILDYNSKKELVGLQIMGASKVLQDLTNETARITKEVLSHLQECRLDAKAKNNLLIIRIFLNSKIKEISSVLSVPSIREPSPALVYV